MFVLKNQGRIQGLFEIKENLIFTQNVCVKKPGTYPGIIWV